MMDLAQRTLPKALLEAVEKADRPFVQVIADIISPEVVFQGGKVILVGDSICGPRPHTAASTSQAAIDSMLLSDVLVKGDSMDEYSKGAQNCAKNLHDQGKAMGDKTQFGNHPLRGDS